MCRLCKAISRDMLEELNVKPNTAPGVAGFSPLESLLGYRLTTAEAPKLHSFVFDECGGHSSQLIAGKLFANALWFCTLRCIQESASLVRFDGLLHGDLHPENVLLPRTRPDNRDYYLIDFALSNIGPLGYDHAYLELALALHFLNHFSPERMISLLRALDTEAESESALQVPTEDLGALHVCRAIRSEICSWQCRHLPKSTDSFEAQLLLTRVAAGLNWANKSLDTQQRRLALAYACYAATAYLKRFHQAEWHGVEAQAASRLRASGSQTQDQQASSTWSAIRTALGNFDRTNGKYVLVLGRPAALKRRYCSHRKCYPGPRLSTLIPKATEAGATNRFLLYWRRTEPFSTLERKPSPLTSRAALHG